MNENLLKLNEQNLLKLNEQIQLLNTQKNNLEQQINERNEQIDKFGKDNFIFSFEKNCFFFHLEPTKNQLKKHYR